MNYNEDKKVDLTVINNWSQAQLSDLKLWYVEDHLKPTYVHRDPDSDQPGYPLIAEFTQDTHGDPIIILRKMKCLTRRSREH